jgi:nitrogen fixation protein NifX
VVASKIHPIKVNQPEVILDVLDKLQVVLKGTPPPWLRKAVLKGREVPAAFDDDGDATTSGAAVATSAGAKA